MNVRKKSKGPSGPSGLKSKINSRGDNLLFTK